MLEEGSVRTPGYDMGHELLYASSHKAITSSATSVGAYLLRRLSITFLGSPPLRPRESDEGQGVWVRLTAR